VYILAESFKFVRFYPLGQNDLPLEVIIFLRKKCDVSRIAVPVLLQKIPFWNFPGCDYYVSTCRFLSDFSVVQKDKKAHQIG
jgi:hypothetical protein